jgi:hypothetical protein
MFNYFQLGTWFYFYGDAIFAMKHMEIETVWRSAIVDFRRLLCHLKSSRAGSGRLNCRYLGGSIGSAAVSSTQLTKKTCFLGCGRYFEYARHVFDRVTDTTP